MSQSLDTRVALVENQTKTLDDRLSVAEDSLEDIREWMHKTIGRQSVLLYIPILLQIVLVASLLWEKFK
jgi:hypothetical protein